MTHADPAELNPYAPPEAELGGGDAGSEPFEGFLGYAGFWRRALAFTIDYFVMVLLIGVGAQVLDLVIVLLRDDGVTALTPLAALLTFLSFNLAVPILYFAGLESSRHQATLGKYAAGIKVTDTFGNRIGFLRALGRLCAKFLSALSFYLGFLMIAFTPQKQGLHDVLASTLVVRSRGTDRHARAVVEQSSKRG